MNGIHDLGGMQGMGAINPEQDEPVFHSEWEAKAFALNIASGAWRKWNIDAGRHQIELLPQADYLRTSYYEKWAVRLIELLIKHGLVTHEEIASGQLVKLVDASHLEDFAYYLVCPENTQDQPKIAAFRKWILGFAARSRDGN